MIHAATQKVAAQDYTFKNEGNAKMPGLAQLERDGKAGKQAGKAGNNGHLTVFRGSRLRETGKAAKSLVRDPKATGKGFDDRRWVRNARKTVRRTVFSEDRAAAPG